MFDIMSDGQVREWNSVDKVLDRLDLCEDVTLVLRPQDWVGLERLKVLTEKYFPLMWRKGGVVLKEQPTTTDEVILKAIQNVESLEMF